MKISQAVILAGGLGTRLKPFTDHDPKPMIEIEGKPFLYYLLNQVKDWGITDVVLLLGYLPEKIQQYFGDGHELGLNITYSVTPVEYDTGARLRTAQDDLQEEFILLYCDNYCPINFQKAYQQYRESGNLIQITAYSNKDGYTKNNLCIEDGQVKVYDKKRITLNLQAVDIGYCFVDKSVLSYLPQKNVNFEAAVYPELVRQDRLGVYVTDHRYYSIGSWERIDLTREFFKPRKVVFLDRDGTLNVRPPKACYVESVEEFVWLPKAREAIKELKDHGYELYLISNQPGIARGRVTEETMSAIHRRMQNDLTQDGVQIDGIYICPHGWDDGCDCRKPKPGMIYQAQKEHSINLTKCILIGDDERDIEAGMAADIQKCILVSEEYTLWDAVQELLKDEELY